MVDYSKGKIYCIEPISEHDEGEIYIGSTTKHYLSDRYFSIECLMKMCSYPYPVMEIELDELENEIIEQVINSFDCNEMNSIAMKWIC